jgi:phosphoglycolate phosphatase-like HAD superfamily hydrolase
MGLTPKIEKVISAILLGIRRREIPLKSTEEMIKGLLVSASLCHGVKEILPDLFRNHNASILTNSPRGFVQATLKEGELLGFWNKILTLEDLNPNTTHALSYSVRLKVINGKLF